MRAVWPDKIIYIWGVQMTATSKKNTGIELLRIIACFMVILAHIRPVLILDDGQIADGALLVQSFLAPGVGLFFLITGCFIPNMPVLKAWRKFALGVALPTLIFVFCVDLLEGYLDSTTDIFTSIRQADIKLILSGILKGILAFDATQLGRLNGHIWFIFSYAVIMLWLPLLHAIVKADARRPLIFFAILSILKLFIIDLNRLWSFPVVLYLPELPPYEILYAAAGYLLYQHITKAKQTLQTASAKPQTFLILLLYTAAAIAIMVLTFVLQHKLFLKQLSEGGTPADVRLTAYYMNWLSGFSVVLAISVMAAVLWLPELSGTAGRLILKAGSVSFPVFLLHFPLVHKLRTSGIEARAMQLFGASHGAGAITYSFIYAAIIFILSAVICCVFRLIYKKISKRIILNG